MKGHVHSRALVLLLVMVTGGFIAPVVHRIQHGVEWHDERQAAREAAAHAHQHQGVAFCAPTAHIPDALQDSPCILCSGIVAWNGLEENRLIPSRPAWVIPAESALVRSAGASASHVIRGPPAVS